MIGIYGGTFNPVHYGHLRTALEVKEALMLDQLRLTPCRLPPHRRQPEVSAELRLQMLQLAVADVAGMIVDRRELDREGPSYMVDTLASVRSEVAASPLLLIIGADAFIGLEKWHRWRHLFEYAHVVVMTRPGYRQPVLNDYLARRLTDDPEQLRRLAGGYLYFQTVTRLEISATHIRELIGRRQDPRFLLPEAVIHYIRQHNLYRSI